jgi:hypothetical protein
MNLLNTLRIPMSVLKRKLKQVASGLSIAALFLAAGIAIGGPEIAPEKRAMAQVDAVMASEIETAPRTEQNESGRLAVSSAMRMPYFSFGKLLPRASVLSNTVEP